MIEVHKVDPDSNTERLLTLFNTHKLPGIDDARRLLGSGGCDLWFAIENVDLLGALLATEKQCDDGKVRGCPHSCLVTARRRRTGVARQLIAVAERHYRTRGLNGMEFVVSDSFEMYPQLLATGWAIVGPSAESDTDNDQPQASPQTGIRQLLRKEF